jgi:divalent metal cation (Fe/Co/Zn/Cd) transporter
VDHIIHMKTQHLGPDELLVAAKLEFVGGLSTLELAVVIDEIEDGLREAVPIARAIYLEPDIRRNPEEG